MNFLFFSKVSKECIYALSSFHLFKNEKKEMFSWPQFLPISDSRICKWVYLLTVARCTSNTVWLRKIFRPWKMDKISILVFAWLYANHFMPLHIFHRNCNKVCLTIHIKVTVNDKKKKRGSIRVLINMRWMNIR